MGQTRVVVRVVAAVVRGGYDFVDLSKRVRCCSFDFANVELRLSCVKFEHRPCGPGILRYAVSF